MLRSIRRYVFADREINNESNEILALDEPVLGNLEEYLPEPPADRLHRKD